MSSKTKSIRAKMIRLLEAIERHEEAQSRARVELEDANALISAARRDYQRLAKELEGLE